MIRRKYVRTRQLKPGMVIDHSIEDRMGRDLVTRGATLDEYIIDSLLKLGIMSVFIQDGEYEPEDAEKSITPIARKNIERLRKEDVAKLKLSDSVRRRIAEGIQYIYNNTDSIDLADATHRITTDLMAAIEENDALAIDIGQLKTSDEYTFKHSVDVATISMILAKKSGYSKKQIGEVGIAGLLHDIGKTKVPLEILNKTAALDDDEFAVMKQHSVFGYRMIQNRPEFSQETCLAVLQHHEKANGTGYPMQATADQITPYAKLLSIADVYDALITERPYKSAYSQRDAIETIMSMSSELDIDIMRCFLESMILYPVDSFVELSNGEKAKVVRNTPGYILRPVVVGIISGKVYDLGNDMSCANIVIK